MRRVLLHGPCKGGLYPLPPSTSMFEKPSGQFLGLIVMSH
jgi:hypothetical protein